MTLDTRIYVTSQVDPRTLFHACQTILSLYDDQRRGPDQQHWSDKDSSYSPGRLLSNLPGQNLPAWLMLHYQPQALYRTPQDAAVHDHCNHPDEPNYDPDEPTCTLTEHEPPCWVEISLDTTYGYSDSMGRGVGDLHAELVHAIGRWLSERGVSWRWENEFTGDIYDGFDGLDTLGSAGAEAQRWFRGTVLPAILSEATR